MKILHIQARDAIGGTERANFLLLKTMDRARFANEICVLGREGPYQSAYAAQAIPAHYLRHNPLRLVQLLRQGNYDLIFLYGLWANLLGRLLGRLFSRARLVEVKRSVDNNRGWLARALDRWTAALVHAFISNSHAGARVMARREGKPADRITVIHSGVPEAAEPSFERGSPRSQGIRIIAVANLLPYKGHCYLIEAIRLLREQGFCCELILAGDGPERKRLERIARRAAPAAIRFLGRRPDVPDLLACADILAQPSLTEGLPNAILEAMLAGLPVVATEVGGNGELVRDGETGLLVPPASAADLARALARLCASSELRRRMGAAGRQRALDEFPLRKTVARFEDFCDSHAAGRPDVLFFTTTGMAVRYLLRAKIEALAAAGYRVRVLCGADSYAAGAAGPGIVVDTLKLSRFFRPLSDLRALAALVRYLRRVRPRMLHTSTPKAGILGPLAARIVGIPAVHTVAGLLFHDRASPLQALVYRAAERLTASCARYLLFQSREDLEAVRVLGWKSPERLLYLGNGINLDRFNPAAFPAARQAARAELGCDGDDFVVGIVARLLRTKGLEEFLAAVEQLRPYSRLRFVVVGPVEEGHPQAITREAMQQACAGGQAQFLGERQDMARLYAAMDLFVLPSYREGLPRSLMEASAMGLPVIASDIRGCREVVEPGRTGWLVPVRDARALAAAILEAWGDPLRAREFGRAGRERVRQHFDERLVAARLLRWQAEWFGQGSVEAPLKTKTDENVYPTLTCVD